jgi:uncharacterized ferritin-like protein (DUF455 family)
LSGGGLLAAAATVLATSDPAAKAALSAAIRSDWIAGKLTTGDPVSLPERPARPLLPELRLPRDMPRRRIGGPAGRVALLHAIAHIELNAIDLAWDFIARFGAALPDAALDDWVRVGSEEARHFTALSERLNEHGAAYGDLPAHDGLWQTAEATQRDVLARLAIVPLILEARGLDVTPAMIAGFERAGDERSAAILRIILRDEITHVATGMRWYRHICAERPFNGAARQAAAFPAAFYEPLADSSDRL